MKALHALTAMEDNFLTELAGLYGCEEDDLPVTVDLVEIYNGPAADRGNVFRSLLTGCPGDCNGLIDKTVNAMAELDAAHK